MTVPVEPLPRPAVMPDWASMVRSPHQMLALSFGLGLSRVAPGTAGAIGGFALYAALFQISPGLRAVVYIALIILASIASSRTGADLGKHDHNSIVIDETLGMSLTLEAAPLSWEAWIAAFFPVSPVRYLETLAGQCPRPLRHHGIRGHRR